VFTPLTIFLALVKRKSCNQEQISTFVINSMETSVKEEIDPSGSPDFAVEPISRTDFERRHAADPFLGKGRMV
jgi:hypothetical protein